MTTIRAIPRKEGDRIVCDEITSSIVGIILDAALSKTYSTLQSDSAWFEERLGQVVEVDLQGHHCKADRDGDCRWKNCPQLVEHKTHCPLDLNVDLDPEDDLIDTIFAIPPKQDLWDEALDFLKPYSNPFVIYRLKISFEILKNNGYTLQKK